ncbi:hypothetical protein OQA88_641 [Cercophora sp. LCS_1]
MALFLLYYATCLVALLALHPGSRAAAQFLQNFQPLRVPDPLNPGTSYDGYKYRAVDDASIAWRTVIDLRKEAVNMHYNCHYMTNICKNIDNFKLTARGQNLHPGTSIPAGTFTYDFDVADSGARSHADLRRDQSCPSTWKDTHACPEPAGQRQTVWRHDGPWWTTDLEPGTQSNMLRHERDGQNQITKLSQMRYSCEEWPPASWVEGGSGWNYDQPASTFCAGLACVDQTANNLVSIKAEQNWQGLGHAKLREVLLSEIDRRNAEFQWHNPHQPQRDVAFFRFSHFDQERTGIAVTIFIDDEVAAVDRDFSYITQAKRQVAVEGGNPDEPTSEPRSRFGRTAEQAYQRMLAGHGRRIDIPAYANGSTTMADLGLGALGGMGSSMGMQAAGFANPSSTNSHSRKAAVKRQTSTSNSTDGKPLVQKASAADLARARSIVAEAIAASAKLNKARLENPARNRYRLKPGTVIGGETVDKRDARFPRRQDANDTAAPPPLLEITDEIARAAALVAEADAVAPEGVNLTSPASSNITRRAPVRGTYWMETMDRRGTVPWGDSPTYKVFRNVLDYGATGNGVTDDTAAIKAAMNDGGRCGEKCNGSTLKNAIVYFPPGTYLISSTIPLPFGTQVIGDVLNRPLLIASSSFVGLGVLSTSEYTGGGIGPDGLDQQWYVNTANFYRQIRNVIIDVRNAPASEITACLHYQIAQATSMQNVELRAGPGSKGIFAENGSGGQISDVVFKGGDIGLYGGNQQFTAQRLRFEDCDVGVHVIWDWGWVWKSVTMTNVGVGFRFASIDSSGSIGSASIMDSSFSNVGTVVVNEPPSSAVGSSTTGLVLDNVALSGVTTVVADTSGTVHLSGSGQSLIDQWVQGPVYSGSANASARSFSTGGKIGRYRREWGLLDNNGAYFERPKPQYEERPAGDFLHVKDFGALGDGQTDDSDALQRALHASQGKILFIDAGSYILTKTVVVPVGVRVVGETWSQLVASGPNFADATNPMVMLRVGETPGQVGNVEMQDLIFTTKGATAGAVLVEWNMAADAKGSAAMWDCHARIGGATGTDLTPDECPALRSGIAPNCNAASLMMHIKPGSSGYFENVWLWVADHDIDDPDLVDANNTMVQNSVYVARGLLVESTAPTWLYGTSSEHAVYYQYNFHNAANIFAGMIQTESPYYQPTPPPPAPFANVVGLFPGDPDYTCAPNDEFSGCDESWGVIMRGCEDVFIAGAGLYSWFTTYTQECIGGQECQKAMVLLEGNHASVRFQHLITIGVQYMAVMEGQGIPAADNLNVDAHPFWSQISILDVASDGAQFNDIVWADPDIWNQDEPEFSCVPPCRVRIPPYTGATSVVNFPLMTVSKDAWTSTITVPPMTLSSLGFDLVTLAANAAGGGLNRRSTTFGEIWPVPATTSNWPVVVYTGPDGKPSTASPTTAFPTPPPSIGPNAAAPANGAWPVRPIVARAAAVDPNRELEDKAKDALCRHWASNPQYWDMLRLNECPGFYNLPSPGGEIPLGGGWGWDVPEIVGENGILSGGENIFCELPQTTTTSTTPTSAPTPTSRRAEPSGNEVHCFKSGQTMSNERLQNGRRSACNNIRARAQAESGGRKRQEGVELKGGFKYENTFHQSGGQEEIHITFEVFNGCAWTFNMDECLRYLSTPVDSCNCERENAKQGGWGKNNCLGWMVDPNHSW